MVLTHMGAKGFCVSTPEGISLFVGEASTSISSYLHTKKQTISFDLEWLKES